MKAEIIDLQILDLYKYQIGITWNYPWISFNTANSFVLHLFIKQNYNYQPILKHNACLVK